MSSLKNKRILITGAAGSIGSELCRQLSLNNKIYVVDINETGVFDLITELQEQNRWVYGRVGDIRSEATVQDIFSDFKPQIIFHAAAYKHVTPMEWTPLEAIQTNIIGTYNLINYAKKWECTEKFVFISTDKAVQSNSIMGATKRLGEIMCKNQGRGFVVVRFGNVLGSRGSVIPIWQRQIDHQRPLTITDKKAKRYFMTIEEACGLVIEAAARGRGGEIYVMDMGEQIKVLDLAKEIIGRRKIPTKTIGLRPGESLEEKLMFEEEKLKAKKEGNFWVIR